MYQFIFRKEIFFNIKKQKKRKKKRNILQVVSPHQIDIDRILRMMILNLSSREIKWVTPFPEKIVVRMRLKKRKGIRKKRKEEKR